MRHIAIKVERRGEADARLMRRLIPQDEYVEHEIRLWGHVQGIVKNEHGAVERGHTSQRSHQTANIGSVGRPSVSSGVMEQVCVCSCDFLHFFQFLTDAPGSRS